MSTYNGYPFVPYERRRVIYRGLGHYFDDTPNIDTDHFVSRSGVTEFGTPYAPPEPIIGDHLYVSGAEGADGCFHGNDYGRYAFHNVSRYENRMAHLYNALILEVQTYFVEEMGTYSFPDGAAIGLASIDDEDATVHFCGVRGVELEGVHDYEFVFEHPTTSAGPTTVSDYIFPSRVGGADYPMLNLLTIVIRAGDGAAEDGGIVAELFVDRILAATLQLPALGGFLTPMLYCPDEADAYVFATHIEYYYRYIMTSQGYRA